jgi:hypothetical protein
MTEPVTMSGRHIHQAAHALVTVRSAPLDRAGVTFTQWKVLDKAPGINRDEVIHQLADLTMNDRADIAAAIDELQQRDLLSADGGTLELTARDGSCASRSAPSGPATPAAGTHTSIRAHA